MPLDGNKNLLIILPLKLFPSFSEQSLRPLTPIKRYHVCHRDDQSHHNHQSRHNHQSHHALGKGAKKKMKKKLTSVSFMYVCLAENGEMLGFFSFFSPTIV